MTIADPSNCIADVATLEDIICTQELIGQFEADYGPQLNKEERKALGGIGCMGDYDDFVEEAICLLNKNEFIIEDVSLLNCPLLYCLYNKIASQQENNFICKYLGNSFDSENFPVLIKVVDTGISSAFSFFDSSLRVAEMHLDQAKCNDSSLNEVAVVAQILHEFVHIEMFREMVEAGLDPNVFIDYYVFWDSYANYITEWATSQGEDEVHHHIMIKYENTIRSMAESLFSLFDGESNNLSVDHFMFTAANGLFHVMLLHSSSDPNFNKLYGDFNNKYSSLGLELNTLNLSLGCK